MARTEAAEAAAHMARALRLAGRGRYTTAPNPRVGCVIVRKGAVIAEGFHARAGGPHAEIEALNAAGTQARGAEVFVTLEPCAHHGRTPPCVDALIDAGVSKVWAAMEDPNPRVAGQGLAALRGAGIAVDVGLMEDEALALNRGFVSRMTRGRPWLTLKLAASLDGRTAMASGESQWISSTEARADVHRQRAEAGAVLTGSSTVLADDPQLTVRDGPVDARAPDRIVLDTQLRTPADARVWAPGARRFALTVRPRSEAAQRLRDAGVEVVLMKADSAGRVDLAAALQTLAQHEVNAVLVECGPQLAGAWLRSGLVDELLLYTAPLLLGDAARPLAQLPGLDTLAQSLRWEFAEVRRIGPDLRLRLTPMTTEET